MSNNTKEATKNEGNGHNCFEIVARDNISGYAPIGNVYREANAALIAAAPDLLEALEEATSFVDRHSEDWYMAGQELLAKCRLALAKAKGQDDEVKPPST